MFKPLLRNQFVSGISRTSSADFSLHCSTQVFDLASYIPDSIYPQYEEWKDAVISLLEKLGIVKPSPDAAAGLFF